MIDTRRYSLMLVAVLVQALSGSNGMASNVGTTDPNPCESITPCDNSCSLQQSAMGTPVGSDGMGGPGLAAGGGCASGSCGNGGLNPQFPANTGVNGAGFAGFSLNLGAPSTPGGLGGGVLFFQIKTLEVGGLPLSAVQYSLAPAKPVVLASGKVVRNDLWNKRHDYLPASTFIMKADNASDLTTLRLLNAQGQPVTNAPASIELINFSGDVMRYRVGNTNLPEVAALPEYTIYNSKLGVWRNPADYGVGVTRTSDGLLSEIATAVSYTRIAPVNTYTFDVIVYPPEGRTSSVPPIVTYRVQGEPEGTVHFSADRSMWITEMRPGYTNLSAFTYNPLNERWTFAQGNGERRLTRLALSAPPNETVIMEVHDNAGRLLARREDARKSFAWGYETVSTTLGTGTCATVTYNEFYTSSSETGRYARLKNIIQSSGEWTQNDYDTQGRTIRETRSWKNIPFSSGLSITNAHNTLHEYGADPQNRDPLVTTECIEGRVVSRTYHSNTKKAFSTFAPPPVSITEIKTERAFSPEAAQGNASNLVSTEYYFDEAGGSASMGAIKASIHPDGTMESCEYAFGTFNGTNDPCFSAGAGGFHRTLKTHGTTQSPSGIAFKTTRDITIRDALGHIVFEETQVNTGSGYQRMSWQLHTYDASGYRVRSDFADGTFRAWDYTAGRLVSSTDRDGTVQTYAFDGFGRLTDTTHQGVAAFGDFPGQLDRTSTKVYDAMHRPVADMQTAGDLTLVAQREYDVLGRPVSETDPRGLVTQYGYASNGLVRTVTSPGGLVQTSVQNLDGRARSVSENGVLKSVHDYGVNSDGTQWQIAYTGPAGTNSPVWQRTTTDFLGRIVKDEKPGFGAVILANAYDYNSRGLLIRVSGVNGQVSLNEYDDLGQKIRSGLDVNTNGVLDLAGPDRVSESIRRYVQRDGDWYNETLSLVYPHATAVPVTNAISRSSAGGLSCGCAVLKSEFVDILGNATVSETAMDSAHKLVTKSVRSPASTNAATSVTYNGLPVESTSATGIKTIYTQDALGRQISALQGGPGAPRTVGSYTVYNALNQVVSTLDAASNRTSFVYDELTGRSVAVVDALSNVTHTAYDAEGRVTNTWGSTYPVAYGYDAYGRMVSMRTYRAEGGTGDETQWLYDEATGLLTNKVYADGKGTAYSYTQDGKLASRTWARGVTTDYNYDSLGQLTNINYSDNTPDVSFAYDRLGRQVSIIDATGTRTFAYNDVLQLAVETNVMGVISRQYDGLGRAAGFELWNGGTRSVASAYSYDALGRFSSVTATNNQSPITNNLFCFYSYLPGSDLISEISNQQSEIHAKREYEPNRNLITQILNTSGTNLISQFDYVNDAVGRRTLRIDVGSAVATNVFGYNSRSELTTALMGANFFAWELDSIGNRISASGNNVTHRYTANALYQYTQITNGGLRTLSYDSDGNLTNDGAFAYSWDSENRMIRAASESAVAHYSYDYMSRRYQKIANGVTNRFFYDGWNLVSEISDDGSQSITNCYVWSLDLSETLQGAGGIGGLLSVTRNGVTYFPCYDANGNITDYVDISGVVVAHREYDAYGNTLSSSGSIVDDFSLWFSSKYLDKETGLLYFGQRFYQPGMGRWASRDPIVELGFFGAESVYSRGRLNLSDYRKQNGTARDLMGDILKDPEFFAKVLADPVKLKQVIDVLGEGGSACVTLFLKNKLQEQTSDQPYLFVKNRPVAAIDSLGLAVFPVPFPGFLSVPWPLNLLPPCSGPANGQAGPQDNICSGPAAGFNDNPCLKQCCKEHDDCYTLNGCNQYSWIPGCGSVACKLCNVTVAACFASFSGDGGLSAPAPSPELPPMPPIILPPVFPDF